MTYALLIKIKRPDNGHTSKLTVEVQADTPERAQEQVTLPKGYSGYRIEKVLAVNEL